MRKALLVAVIGAFLLQPLFARTGGTAPDFKSSKNHFKPHQPAPAAGDAPLKFYQNYFITGDYAVGGTGLFRKGRNGLATQDIIMNGVPPDAEILAAYLYIQTTVRESRGPDAGIAGATFKGHSLNPDPTPGVPGDEGPMAKALNWDDGTQACWSYGWNPRRRMVTYRADVLRFLEIGANGKHVVNGKHQVQVADSGRGHGERDDEDDRPTMTGPRAIDASLLVVYRYKDPDAPMKAIVIYDGGVTKRSRQPFSQTIEGFYEPTAHPDARMTLIVGDRPGLFSERVSINGQPLGRRKKPRFGVKHFQLDDPTFDLADSALRPYPQPTTVSVVPYGCLSVSGLVVSAEVQDSDNDGLLDMWEQHSGIVDPNGQPLPDLSEMADPLVKDIFVEIGSMFTNQTVTYGSGVSAKTKEPHSHLPTQKALDLVGDAFRDAPERINVHFDVGNNYQEIDPTTGEVDPYIIPARFARGGETISETAACTDPSGPTGAIECAGQYPLHPGTVGWKTGFRFLRDEPLTLTDDDCESLEQDGDINTSCERRFDRNRKDIFRYALFAHALGIPKSEDEFMADGTSANPDFHVPRTNSGVGDWAGGDLLITLGAFDDNDGNPVGTDFMQASTLMHEWGHNFGRRHGGDLFEPNCKPQYLSVMNYLYQLRGLPDVNGVPRLSYNTGDPEVSLSELSLSDGSVGNLRYRMGWYAPKATSYLKNLTGGAATKHCDGSPLLLTDRTEMVRVDATSVGGAIDWNADGLLENSDAQDINFDGSITPLNPGSNDWASLRLNQLGSRRSVGGLFLDKTSGEPTVGPMSLNVGKGDLGKGDLGKGDLGKGDLGKGDLGKGDLGKGDLGKGDLGGSVVSLTLGKGDLGKGDLGLGDLDVGSGTPAEQDVQELDFETATAATGGNPTPPSALQACLTSEFESEFECATEGGDRPVKLQWLAPNLGQVVNYLIYRFEYTPPFEAPAELTAEDQIAVVGASETTFLDGSAPANKHLAYYVIAEYDDDSFSGISNFATVKTPANPIIQMVDLGTSAPPSSLGDETLGFQSMTPFAADERPIFSDVTTVNSPLGGELIFGASVSHRTVGEGGWATWSHGYTGDVYFATNSTSLTMTLPVRTTAFYFYAEPNIRSSFFTFTVTTSDGGTAVVASGDVPIHGEAGARGFGFYSSNTTIVSVVVTGTDPTGFAVGEFGIAGPPLTSEP